MLSVYLKFLHVFLILLLTITFNISGKGQDHKQLTIVAFGNSTTAPRKNVKKVYAVRLEQILINAGINAKVINSGKPGSHTGSVKDNDRFKIAHGMDRFDTAVLRYHPDWVIICFGLNDSWVDTDSRWGKSRIPLDEYRRNLSFFIDEIHHEGGRVILMAPNPVGKKFEIWRHRRVKKYADVVRKLAKSKKVFFVDTWKLFNHYVYQRHENIDALLLDGMHPNDAGHRIWANAIARIMLNTLTQKQS